jgi:hypothetical protein
MFKVKAGYKSGLHPSKEGIMSRSKAALAVMVFIIAAAGCSRDGGDIVELKHYPVDNLEGVIMAGCVEFDDAVFEDGNGSIRAATTEPQTFRLYETGDIDVEDARLIYQARLRTRGVEGRVYLEMYCHFADKGDAFSRGLQTPLTGNTDWVTEEIPFFLRKGENPDNVRLNLVIDGSGTAWIDDIRLLKGPR